MAKVQKKSFVRSKETEYLEEFNVFAQGVVREFDVDLKHLTLEEYNLIMNNERS